MQRRGGSRFKFFPSRTDLDWGGFLRPCSWESHAFRDIMAPLNLSFIIVVMFEWFSPPPSCRARHGPLYLGSLLIPGGGLEKGPLLCRYVEPI